MNKKWFSLLVLFLLCMISYVSVTADQWNSLKRTQDSDASGTLCHVIIKIKDASQVASLFIKEGFDVLDGTITNDSFEMIVHPSVLQQLRTYGFHVEVLSQGRPFREIQIEQNQGVPLPIPPGYLDYPDIIDELYTTENNYPSICKVYDLTTLYNLSSTYEGRHLFALKISDNVAQDEDEPNFLMVSNHHAREVVTPVLALYAIEQLTTGYGTNATVTAAVDNYEIWIAPSWNPDGYSYVYHSDNNWRKNRYYFPQYGTYGVDLNRNYPIGWYSSGSGSSNPIDETYKGPSPASEIETQTMMIFSDDRHFAKVLDYHSYGREVLYSYLSLTHPFTSFLQSEAQRLSVAVGYGGATRLASADGENYQWHLAFNGSYANLIETHTTFQPTYASALSEAALVWPGTLWMLQRPISISGHVTDAATGAPLVANITLEGIQFTNGEYYMSEPRYGRYHLFLPPGTYTVNFSAPEHHPQTRQITITLSSEEILDIPLEGFNEPPYTPTITGPTDGFTGEQYEYRFSTNDPENDSIEYFIDWGDGTSTLWLGPFESGQEATASHQWSSPSTFQVKVKAKDPSSEESQWSNPVYVHILSFNRALVFGFITEKNDTGDFITFNAKLLIISPRLYHSDETIMISKDFTFGFVGERVVLGVFDTLVL
jgi:carboxypeptidase T